MIFIPRRKIEEEGDISMILVDIDYLLKHLVYSAYLYRNDTKMRGYMGLEEYIIHRLNILNITNFIELRYKIIYDESIWYPEDESSYGNIVQFNVLFLNRNFSYRLDLRTPIREQKIFQNIIEWET